VTKDNISLSGFQVSRFQPRALMSKRKSLRQSEGFSNKSAFA